MSVHQHKSVNEVASCRGRSVTLSWSWISAVQAVLACNQVKLFGCHHQKMSSLCDEELHGYPADQMSTLVLPGTACRSGIDSHRCGQVSSSCHCGRIQRTAVHGWARVGGEGGEEGWIRLAHPMCIRNLFDKTQAPYIPSHCIL